MPSIDKKYYHNLDLDSNEIKAGRIYNLTTTQRNALTLLTTDKGYLVYDTTLLSLFVWNGTAWVSAGGAQNLQQVTTTGNTTTNNIILNSTSGEYPDNAIGQNTITDRDIYITYSSATYPFNHSVYLGGGSAGTSLSLISDNNGIGSTTDIGGGGISIIASDSFNQAEINLSALDSADGSAFLELYNASQKNGILKVTNLTNIFVTLQFPNEITGDYTIPTNVNGTYADSTGKITLATAGFEQNFLLMGA
jgi:hypothetical protein